LAVEAPGRVNQRPVKVRKTIAEKASRSKVLGEREGVLMLSSQRGRLEAEDMRLSLRP